MTMTETEELEIRRNALKDALAETRAQLSARENARATLLTSLVEVRDSLAAEVLALEGEVAEVEATADQVTEEWRAARRDVEGARAHLAGLTGADG